MTDRRFINQQNLNDRGVIISVDCRFCRLVQKYDKYLHVAPCGCAGGTRYVHRECLERWVVVKFEHVYNHDHNGDPQQFNIFCEVCQQRMEVTFTLTHKLSKYEDFVEKIIARKIFFAALLLLGAGSLVSIIVLLLFGSESANGFPPRLIFGLAVSAVSLAVVIVIFVCCFMVLRSIEVDHIANNKNPMIMGLQANLDSVSEEEGSEKDPYFGVEPSRKAEVEKSLMLESKRDSGSVVSKTLTDLVMVKMYKHDEPSLKGKSEKDFNTSRFDKLSRFSKLPVKETRDQEVQIELQKQDKSIQQSLSLKNQSIQPSQHLKDASVQPSLLPTRTRRIFKEDPSVLPPSSVAEPPLKDHKMPPKKIEKVFISEYQENIEPPTSYRKPTALEPELPSSGESKKSEEEMVSQPPKKEVISDAKLKLKTLRDPIKIRVMF